MDITWRRPGLRGTLLYAIAALVVGALASFFCRVEITRRREDQRLPDGPVIVVANHTSLADGILLALACRRLGRSVRLLATAGVFDVPLLGSLVRRLGFIPVRRGTEQARDALAPAAAALRAGEVVGLFPEGRLTRDPAMWPERARTGAVRLALETGAPVVPVAIDGAHEVIGRAHHARRLLRSLLVLPEVRISVGDPIDVSGLATAPDSEAEIRWLSDLMMGRLVQQVEALRGEAAEHRYGVPPAA